MSIRNLVTFTVFAGASIAFAQVQSGRLVGTIYDQTHAAVPNASVTVTNVATNIARSTQEHYSRRRRRLRRHATRPRNLLGHRNGNGLPENCARRY